MKALILTLIIFSSSFSALAQKKKVAVVKIIRGEVESLTLGKTSKLKVDDWVEDGAMIKTAEKSFAKLIFIDKSQMNIGPNSQMKIEKFNGHDSGVIDLVKGKIRSQVTKDYLQMKNKDKSKLFIKTPNAVMGVRGTDFMISTNGKNTAAILFEGEIVFNKLGDKNILNTDRLESIVDRGVRMHPGEFSVVESRRPEPTVPSLINVQQKETLQKNETFDERAPSSSTNDMTTKAVVPEGLDGQIVSNKVEVLKTEIASVSKIDPAKKPVASANPDGYIRGDKVKPANGAFVDIDSGIIIPPGPDSILDSNTNTYIPGPKNGTIGSDGEYIPPANIEITSSGEILMKTDDGTIAPIPAPSPIMPTDETAPTFPTEPEIVVAAPKEPIQEPVVFPTKTPTGGIQDINTAVQTSVKEKAKVNINVRSVP